MGKLMAVTWVRLVKPDPDPLETRSRRRADPLWETRKNHVGERCFGCRDNWIACMAALGPSPHDNAALADNF